MKEFIDVPFIVSWVSWPHRVVIFYNTRNIYRATLYLFEDSPHHLYIDEVSPQHRTASSLLDEDAAEAEEGTPTTGTPPFAGELSLLSRCMTPECCLPGRRATTAATMALAPTTAFDCTPDAAGCTWIDRVSSGLVGAELLVCSSGFSMVVVTFDLNGVTSPGSPRR